LAVGDEPVETRGLASEPVENVLLARSQQRRA
jgi:hypothetical protein